MNIEANRAMRPDIDLAGLNDKENKEVIEAFGQKLREGAPEISKEDGKKLKEELGKIGGEDKKINTEEEHIAAREKIKEMFDTIPRGTASVHTDEFKKEKSNEDLDKTLHNIGMGLPKNEDGTFKEIKPEAREAFEKAAKDISPEFGKKEKIDDPEEVKALKEKAKEILGAEPMMMRAMAGILMQMKPFPDEIVFNGKAGDKLDNEGSKNLDLLKSAGFDEKALKDSKLLDGDGKLTEDGVKLLQTMGGKFSTHDLGLILEKNGGDAKKTLEDLMTKTKEPDMDRNKLLASYGINTDAPNPEKPDPKNNIHDYVKSKVGEDRRKEPQV